MNNSDSIHIEAELSKHKGYIKTDDITQADLILINTCSVREKPVAKLFSELGQFKQKRKKDAKIGVCGCTASHLGEEIIKRAPYVDFVLGARNVSKIKDIVDIKGAVEVDIDYDDTTYTFANSESSIYKTSINISLGCDKECSYCIVPSTRGQEVSIPPELIIDQIKRDIKRGAKEVLLLGQNVNNYGKRFSDNRPKIDFTTLLKEVSHIEEIKRIRFTSPHPLHMDDKFIQEFASNPKICKAIHMPLQSGSTKVLKDMKRGYTKEWFLNRVQKIKDLVPNVRITTDIIVAFPTETDEDFLETIDVIEKVKFDQIFNFKYSPRPNTSALKYNNNISDAVASDRLTQVIELHKIHQNQLMDSYVGKTLEVMFEALKPNGEVMGYSDEFIQCFAQGSEELLGKIVRFEVLSANRTSLKGKVIEKED